MDAEMNCVNLVITGNPGVGKHTIADLFVKQDSSYQIFDINKFAIEKGFGEKNHDEVEVDTTKLKSEIGKLNFDNALIPSIPVEVMYCSPTLIPKISFFICSINLTVSSSLEKSQATKIFFFNLYNFHFG